MLGIRDTLVYQQMKQDMFDGEVVSWSIVDTPEEFSIKRKYPKITGFWEHFTWTPSPSVDLTASPKKCSNCGQAFYG